LLWVLSAPTAAAEPPAIRFEEVGEAAGARFVHSARSFGDRHKAQVLEMFTDGGAAVAVGDFDGDGHDDLFLTDSGEGKPNRLLRNLYGETGELRFADVTEQAGVAGGNDARSIVADALWLDFDDDGRLDLLVARFGTPLLYRNLGADEARAETSSAPTTSGVPAGAEKHASLSPRGTATRSVVVGRGTEGEGGTGEPPRFQEVSAPAGLTKFANTIAAIAFDYDGDGWLDLLLGNYFPPEDLLALETRHVLPNDLDNAVNGGGVSLWRNVPGGSEATGGRAFVEVTEEAGLAHHTGWTLDLGHGDLDGDGDQDLYLAGDYGTDRLFLNRGPDSGSVPGGITTFEDATVRALGGFDTRKGMNAELADFDRDGWLDVYVTNITDEYMKECNMLWHNQGATAHGAEEAAGEAAAEAAPDGAPDGAPGGITFLDVSAETGTCDTDWGWAAKFGDFDNDGWEDLFVVNGLRSAGEGNYIPLLLETIITPGIDFSDLDSYPDIGERTWSGYQKQRLFRNLGDGTFREMAEEAGVANDLDGRGIGVGDFDRDGRLDLYQSNQRRESLLFRNVTEGAGHWIQLRLVGAGVAARTASPAASPGSAQPPVRKGAAGATAPAGGSERGSNRWAIGARVTVTAGGERYLREVNGGNGYAGQSTTRLHVGLGRAEAVEKVEIRWPNGRVEVLETKKGKPPVPIDAVTTIEEGKGIVE
jgi:hypothetical protein